jgi:hypothetical protein
MARLGKRESPSEGFWAVLYGLIAVDSLFTILGLIAVLAGTIWALFF